MSSAVLYLAIVAVWGVVLVPMWLRRDGDGIGRLLHRRGDAISAGTLDDTSPHARDDDVVAAEEPMNPPEHSKPSKNESREARELSGRRRITRGAVIARRRRRTLGLSLLTLTAIVVSALQIAPWWFVFPPVLLLGGHLSLLRVAVRVDHARRAEHHRRAAFRAERLRRAREDQEISEAREAMRARAAKEAARTAEVIELPGRREEVYDQYTDLRAVGD
jgi:hypothetical protein